MELLMKGNKQRTQEPTAANQTSSRSHAVLQVAVRQQSRCRDVLQEVRFARLFMIDLAGSERAAQVSFTCDGVLSRSPVSTLTHTTQTGGKRDDVDSDRRRASISR